MSSPVAAMPMPSTSNPPPPARRECAAWIWALALGALAILMGVAIWPVGEFPLNDDWSYARAVQSWLETGRLQFTGWTSLPLIAQTLWGALFCLPGGFSFVALRLSTASAGLLGVWGLYFLMRSAGHGRPCAGAAALTLALNPLYVNLSHTFMTDVPFTAACIWALAGFVRSFSDPRLRWLGLGLLGSLAATLIRHTGLILPCAFLVACCLGPRNALRSRAAAIAAIVALALVGFCAYGAARLGLRPFWAHQAGELASGLGHPARMLERAGEIAVYLGLFGLPFGLFLLPAGFRRSILWIWPLAALVAIGLGLLGVRLPLTGNILYDAGLGPVRLFDVTTHGLPSVFSVPSGWWTLATGLGVAGALLAAQPAIAARQVRADPPSAVRPTRWLLGLCAAGWTLPMAIAGYLDRYLLVVLPLWLLFLAAPSVRQAAPSSRGGLAAALALVLCFAGFSVAATHDYFSWNRARWTALDELTRIQQIAPERIDGGFEFNGWHRYDPAHPADRHRSPNRSWWWVADDEYAITLGPVPGYAERTRHPFPRWLGRTPGAILVLQREAP